MRLSCGFIALLLALSVLGVRLSGRSGPVIAKLRVKGEKERAEVIVDGSFEVPVYSIHALNDGKQVVLEIEGADARAEAAPRSRAARR